MASARPSSCGSSESCAAGQTESAEEAQGVRGGSEGKERGRGPAEEQRDGVREQRAHPAEVSLYCGATTDERRVALGGQCATEENREK